MTLVRRLSATALAGAFAIGAAAAVAVTRGGGTHLTAVPAGSHGSISANQVASEASESPEASEAAEATETPDPSETPEASETPEPSETPEATETPDPKETPDRSEKPESEHSGDHASDGGGGGEGD